MRNRILYKVLYPLMFAGCFSASMSASAQSDNLYQRYWQSVNGQFSHSSQSYRFRPADVSFENRRNAAFKNFEQRRAQAFNRFAHLTAMPRFRPLSPTGNAATLYRPSYERTAAFGQPPAFARQFAWTPAVNTVIRSGRDQNHYASEMNDSYEQASVSDYRSAPVSSQGFRYRNSQRNAPYVSFSERVRSALPERQRAPAASRYSQAASRYQPQHHEHVPAAHMQTARVTDMPAPVQPEVSRPAADKVKIFMSSQPLPSAQGFNFRPDGRFGKPAEKPARYEIKQEDPFTVPSQQSPIAADTMQLARAQMERTLDNPWDNWSFRPADAAIQR